MRYVPRNTQLEGWEVNIWKINVIRNTVKLIPQFGYYQFHTDKNDDFVLIERSFFVEILREFEVIGEDDTHLIENLVQGMNVAVVADTSRFGTAITRRIEIRFEGVFG